VTPANRVRTLLASMVAAAWAACVLLSPPPGAFWWSTPLSGSFVGAGLAALLAWAYLLRGRRVVFALAVGFVALPLYVRTHNAAKLSLGSPALLYSQSGDADELLTRTLSAAGLERSFRDDLFSDQVEIGIAVLNRSLTFDMVKHPPFLPAASLAMGVAGLVTPSSLPLAIPLTLGLAGIAALNAAAAALLLQLAVGGAGLGRLLAVAAVFAFAPWYYGGAIETYAFTGLTVQLFLIAWLAYHRAPSRVSLAVMGTALGLAVVTQPPLAVLGALCAASILGRNGGRFGASVRIGGCAALAFCVAFGLGSAIRFTYAAGGSPWAQRSPHDYLEGLRSVYGSIPRMSFATLGDVVLGQTVFAFVGADGVQGYGHGWDSLRSLRGGLGTLSALASLGLLGFLALRGCRGGRPESRRVLVGIGGAALVYVLFFWWFNPGEMVLYSSPLVPAILAFLGNRAERSWPRVALVASFVLVVALALANAAAIMAHELRP